MKSDQLVHKLVAVLYADVAGYSRLTGEDEVGTHRTLSTYLDLFTESIEQHGGKVVHYAGDAILAEFPTVSRALTCGISVQQDIEERNDGLPDESQVRFRIGINLGEVIVDRGDIYGSGVNVAARLESLAQPGGICISDTARTALGTKLPLEYEFLGEQYVKNIKEPVRAYHARLKPDVLLPSPDALPKLGRRIYYYLFATVIAALVGGVFAWLKYWDASDEPVSMEPTVVQQQNERSIAVLPFSNISRNPEYTYFADGMTDDLITDLTKVSSLFVIDRDSAFVYKNGPQDLRKVAQQLNVRYILHGSVRRVGKVVRMNVQLTDTSAGVRNVWAERYDGEMSDIFNLQDSITKNIVSALALKLSAGERQNLVRHDTNNLEAYEYFLQGQERYFRYSKENNQEARRLYRKATELDPAFGRAYAMHGLTHIFDFMNGWTDAPESSLEQGKALAEKAISLDAALPVAYFVTGLFYRERREYVKALVEAQKAIAIDPSYADGHVLLATLLYYAGKPKDGLEVMQRAIRLHPHHAHNYPYHLGQAYFILGHYDEAIETFTQGIKLLPTSERLHLWLAATYAQAGLIDEAQWQANEVLELNPGFSLERMVQAYPFKYAGDLANVINALRKAGLPE